MVGESTNSNHFSNNKSAIKVNNDKIIAQLYTNVQLAASRYDRLKLSQAEERRL